MIIFRRKISIITAAISIRSPNPPQHLCPRAFKHCLYHCTIRRLHYISRLEWLLGISRRHIMASKPAFWLTIFTIWVSTCSGSTLPAFTKATRDVENPIDPKWVQNFAAIGDSYAAGIGAGNVLNGDGYGKCSRYDESYPRMMQYMGYGGDPKFTFLACSGDKSGDVMGQVKKLEDNSQDLVTVSAGGNDALLSDVLKACVFLPSSLEKCKSKLADTKKEIDDTLQNSIDDLLQALAPKVKSGGIIAYSLYAQFFNADTDACSDQSWNWFKGLLPNTNGEIKLTKDLRKQMNDLVVEANTKIKGAIASQSGSTRPSKATIVIADWDKTVGDIKGRLCEKGETASQKLGRSER